MSGRMKPRSILVFTVTCVVGVAIGSGVATGAMDPDWVEKWTEDLVAAHEALVEKHPSPFDHLTAEELRVEFGRLRDDPLQRAHHPRLDYRSW